MQQHIGATALFLALAVAPASARITRVDVLGPITKVLEFIKELQTQTEEAAQAEQKEYDKYSCWCEKTLQEKAKEISELKEQIEKLTTGILKLSGLTQKLKAEIIGYKKEIKVTMEA